MDRDHHHSDTHRPNDSPPSLPAVSLDRRDFFKTALLSSAAIGGLPALSEHAAGQTSGDQDWPQFQFNVTNTGHDPDGSGPTDGVGTLWDPFTTGGRVSSPVVADGVIYFGSDDNKLYAVDADSGSLAWSDPFETNGTVHPPAVVDGTVYVGGGDHVYALDAADGTEQWSWPFPQGTAASALTVADGTVYVPGGDDRFFALDADDGSKDWQVFTNECFGGQVETPAVANDTIYITEDCGQTWAIDAANGDVQWTFYDDSGPGTASPPTVADGTVYFGTSKAESPEGNTVFALDASDGSEQWQFTFQPEGDVKASPAVANGRVFFASTNGNVYALDASDGSKSWEFATGGAVSSSPAVVNGIVYIGSDDGNLYGIDAESGEERFKFEAGSEIQSSPAVATGNVYIGSRDGNLYGLKEAEQKPSLELEKPRLVQTVDNTRDQDEDDPGTVTPIRPNPDLVTGRHTSAVFGLSGDRVDSISSPVTVEFTRRFDDKPPETSTFELTPEAIKQEVGDMTDLSLLGRLAGYEKLSDGRTYQQGQFLVRKRDIDTDGEIWLFREKDDQFIDLFHDRDGDGSVVIPTADFDYQNLDSQTLPVDTYYVKPDIEGDRIATFDISGAGSLPPSDVVKGNYPTFEPEQGLASVGVKIALNSESIDGDDESLAVGNDFTLVPDMPELNVGFIRLSVVLQDEEGGTPVLVSPFLYENNVDSMIRYVERQFPIPEVNAYRHDPQVRGPVLEGDLDNYPSSYPEDFSIISADMEADLQGARDALEEVINEQGPLSSSDNLDGELLLVDEGEITRGPDTVTIDSFDVTVVVVPDSYFSIHRRVRNDVSRGTIGVHFGGPSDGDNDDETQPQASAAVLNPAVLGGDPSVGAHEITHHFLGEIYPDSLAAEDPDDGLDHVHLNEGIHSTLFDIRSNSFDINPGDVPAGSDNQPFMESGGGMGNDVFTYQQLTEGRLEPQPMEEDDGSESSSRMAVDSLREPVLSGIGRTDDGISITRLNRRSGTPMPSAPSGEVVIRSVDPDNNVLDERVFIEGVNTQTGGTNVSDSPANTFLFTIPFPNETQNLEIETEDAKTQINPIVRGLREAISRIPDNGFKNRSDEHRNALINKLDSVDKQMEQKKFGAAKRKMKRDVRDKIEKWLKNDYDVAANQPTKQEMLDLVDNMIDRLEKLTQTGNQ